MCRIGRHVSEVAVTSYWSAVAATTGGSRWRMIASRDGCITGSGANAAVEYAIYEYYAPIWQKVSGLIVPYGRCLGPTKTARWPVGSKSNYSSIRNVLP